MHREEVIQKVLSMLQLDHSVSTEQAYALRLEAVNFFEQAVQEMSAQGYPICVAPLPGVVALYRYAKLVAIRGEISPTSVDATRSIIVAIIHVLMDVFTMGSKECRIYCDRALDQIREVYPLQEAWVMPYFSQTFVPVNT